MATKVLLFSVFHYDREFLEEMTDQEKYELASECNTLFPEEADMMSLKEFENRANDDTLDLNVSWIYFVNI